mgnify:FL=1
MGKFVKISGILFSKIKFLIGITCKEDVLNFGIDRYNEECRSIVMRYSSEWKETVLRSGRWIDFEKDYKTLDPEFMVFFFSTLVFLN